MPTLGSSGGVLLAAPSGYTRRGSLYVPDAAPKRERQAARCREVARLRAAGVKRRPRASKIWRSAPLVLTPAKTGLYSDKRRGALFIGGGGTVATGTPDWEDYFDSGNTTHRTGTAPNDIGWADAYSGPNAIVKAEYPAAGHTNSLRVKWTAGGGAPELRFWMPQTTTQFMLELMIRIPDGTELVDGSAVGAAWTQGTGNDKWLRIWGYNSSHVLGTHANGYGANNPPGNLGSNSNKIGAQAVRSSSGYPATNLTRLQLPEWTDPDSATIGQYPVHARNQMQDAIAVVDLGTSITHSIFGRLPTSDTAEDGKIQGYKNGVHKTWEYQADLTLSDFPWWDRGYIFGAAADAPAADTYAWLQRVRIWLGSNMPSYYVTPGATN